MWADNETDEDLLGFSLHANLIGDIVTDPSMLPITFGLFGDWGGGKSSILKILQRNFSEDPDIAVIYFNSWVFEGYEDAKAAILTSLLTELCDHRNLKNIIKDEVDSLLQRVNWMKVLKSGTSAALAYISANPFLLMGVENPLNSKEEEGDAAGVAGNVPKIGIGDYFKEVEETVHNVRSFRDDFQSLIEKTKLKALVILIDDLDRCSPERVIENLEAVKLFLNVERTAFVVAADRRIVENAIRIRYSDLFTGRNESSATSESLVTDYLEKLIQVPYTLPKLAPHEVRSYMSLLFLKKHLDEAQFDNVLKQYSEFLTSDRYSTFPLEDTLAKVKDGESKKALIDSIRLVESCSDAITDGLKGNPRQIKRFLNAYWIRQKLSQVAQLSHVKNHILVKLMVLEYINAECFDELYNFHRQSSDGIAEPLAEMEQCESSDAIDEKCQKWRTPRLWKWLKSDPKLGEEDLRDYFWLSRSSVSDTLSGVRLLTHAMRQCLEGLLSSSYQNTQERSEFFNTLSEDEQSGVLAMVGKKAMQNPEDGTPLESLLDLALSGSVPAAESFQSCVNNIGADKLKPGLGIKLRGTLESTNGHASKIIEEVKGVLAKTNTKIGRTLNSKKKSTKRR